ncbi:hypothetical protein ACFWDZ_27445 [Micromonospora aurantiaca]|uniref:Uncharacterized protein n=1 Tax=Micromonospora aurantiaca (nom. illeg.) TaxID=47850 RepID=A0A6N3K4X5_9ACTN|nr:hypothetical protein [Micromonospora aurantiaca]AXH92019.1 hypothetical protein DVH21_20005 [Micromonospora aurantiaca]
MTGGRWLVASTVLGRPVTDDESYPHICRWMLAAADALSGRPVYLLRRDCAACAQERHERTHRQPDPAGGAVVDLAVARARRTTRRERPVA